MTAPRDREGHIVLGPAEDGAALITIDRPGKLNALTSSMVSELAAIVDRVNGDKLLRAVTLTGSGRAFCVGSDIGELDRYSTVGVRYARGLRRCIEVPAQACDSGRERLCLRRRPRARARMRHPRGLTQRKFRGTRDQAWVDWGQRPVRPAVAQLGASNAAQMVLTGDPVDADTALAWGLITKLVDPGDLVAVAMEVAKTIALRAPIAAETAKANLRAAWDLSIDAAVDYERRLQTICFATKDAAEGRAAFRERRLPRFTGE